MTDPKLILTTDGSHTVSLPDRDVTYHSKHGAIQESRHVFIQAGLQAAFEQFPDARPLSVFEMGFGTGLNALLTAQEAAATGRLILYTAVEAFPLPPAVWRSLNYTDVLGDGPLFREMHRAHWGVPAALTPQFTICKLHNRLERAPLPDGLHLIYFDAFAPEDDPTLWTEAIFRRLLKALTPGGILVTYCSKGDVRRALEAAGFTVEKLAGPPGKREMVRARNG